MKKQFHQEYVYEQIRLACKPIVKYWKKDLFKHNRKAILLGELNYSFIHIANNHGTHFYKSKYINSDSFYQFLINIIKEDFPNGVVFHYYDGEVLSRVDQIEYIDIILKNIYRFNYDIVWAREKWVDSIVAENESYRKYRYFTY